MTTETANPRATYALAGAGPYALEWPYDAGQLIVQGDRPGFPVATLVAGVDYTLSPASGPSGNLFLGPGWNVATGTLYIDRNTPLEQGWVGTFPGEKGIEAALDRLTRRQQEIDPRVIGALFVETDAPMLPLTPTEGATVIWQDGQFAAGPTKVDLQAVLDAAEAAALSEDNAAGSERSAALSSAEAGAASGRLVAASFSAMMAKFVTSAPSAGQVVPATGDIITVLEPAATYRVVTSGEHCSTTGGVKLVALPFQPGCYHVAQVGAVGVGNETAIIQAFADKLPAGSELHFDGLKTYTLNVTTKNAITFQVNGATLINASNSAVILGIQPDAGEITDHAVVEASLPYNAQTFTVTGASTLFAVGDIGVLWDNARRPSDNEQVNFECVKIKSIAGNVVTLEAPIEGNSSAGAIVFRRSSRQIKNAGIYNARVRPTSGHTAQCLFIQHVENPRAGGNDISGHTGVALAVRYCYGGNLGDNRPTRPASTGSGDGYGVALIACSNTVIGDTIGDGCRHVLDFDSCYRINFGVVLDMNAVSTPLATRHNGFGGSIRGKGLICRMIGTGAYPVGDSAQGYGTGANRALAANHIMRNGRIDFIDAEIDGNPNDFFVGAYFQNGADGVSIGEIRIRYLNNTTLTNTGVSAAIRINGPVLPGGFTVGKVICDRIGSALNRLDDNAFSGAQGVIKIGHIEVTTTVCRMVWMRGGGSLRVGSFYAGDNTGVTLFETVTLGSNTPARVDIGAGQYGGTETQVYVASANIPGEIAPLLKSSATGLTTPAGATYTASQVQNRSGMVRIVGAIGSATDAIASFPPPDFNGQTITVLGKFSGRNNVSIPASVSATGAAILFDAATPARRLVGFGGLWVPLG